MKNNQKSMVIFFFEGTGVIVFSQKHPQGVSFTFPPGSVEHMEIINYDLVHEVLAAACATLEITDALGVIVFGKSLLFDKQIPLMTQEKIDAALEEFTNATPFERVASHTYKNPQGTLLLSMNRDFYDTLRQILERAGVRVVGVIPQFILTGILGTGPMQAKSLALLASKIEEIGSQSIIVHKVMPKTLQEQQEYISKKYSGVLIGVFVLFIIGVIAATAFILRSQFQASRKSAVLPTTAPVASPVVQQTAIPVAVPEQIASPSAVLLTVLYVPESASQAASLRLALNKAGYTQSNIKAQPGLQGSQPLVVFRPTVSSVHRTEISRILREQFTNFAVQEIAGIDTDVSITLAQ